MLTHLIASASFWNKRIHSSLHFFRHLPKISLVIAVSFVSGVMIGGFIFSIPRLNAWEFTIPQFDFPWRNSIQQNAPAVTTRINPLPPVTVSEEEAVLRVVNASVPSVVSIQVDRDIAVRRGVPQLEDFGFFDFGFTVPGPLETTRRRVSSGTGFVVDQSQGLILTNRHVVDFNNADFTVVTHSGKEFKATLLGLDPVNDLAFLKVPGIDAQALPLGSSENLKLGQTVIAIGNTLGEFGNTVTKGVVSGLGRTIVAGGLGSSERLEGAIQTDAAINPGNSGGPLLDLQGNVIGINTAVSSNGQLVGFALPIDSAIQVIHSAITTGKVIRPYLGIRFAPVAEEIVDGIRRPAGNQLVSNGNSQPAVQPNSPAARAGLREGDIIITANGNALNESFTIARVIQRLSPGEKIELHVWRNGKELDITATLGTFDQK